MPLVLSATEFEVAWKALSLGDPPLVFWGCLGHGVLTETEHVHRTASALDGLRQRGLVDGDGPVPELAEALGVLANPRWAIEARLVSGHPDATDTTGGSMRAYGATSPGDDDHAVLATMADDVITLSQTITHRLPTEMATLAGDAQPGPGRSINIRADVLHAAARSSGGDPHRLAEGLVASGIPAGHASTIARINAEQRRGGQFGVEVVGPDGAQYPGRWTVGFNDTSQGRWAQLGTGNDGEPPWLTFTPVSSPQLAAMIGDLLADSGART